MNQAKIKRIIGKICIGILITIIASFIVVIILECGFSIVEILWGMIITILFILIVLAAVLWGNL